MNQSYRTNEPLEQIAQANNPIISTNEPIISTTQPMISPNQPTIPTNHINRSYQPIISICQLTPSNSEKLAIQPLPREAVNQSVIIDIAVRLSAHHFPREGRRVRSRGSLRCHIMSNYVALCRVTQYYSKYSTNIISVFS